jgi:hypothetical protein
MSPIDVLMRLARPSTRLMDRLRLNAKLGLIAAAFIATAVMVAVMLVVRINSEIAVLNLQREGEQAAGLALILMTSTARHDLASDGGDASAAASVHTTLADLKTELDDFEVTERLTQLLAETEAALETALTPADDANESKQRHLKASASIADLINRIAEDTGMNRVRDAHTFYLSSIIINDLPLLQDRSFRLRALGALVIETGAVWVDDRIDIVAASRDMERAKDALASAVRRLADFEKQALPELQAAE